MKHQFCLPQISEHNPRGTVQTVNVITGIFQIVPRGCVQKFPVVFLSQCSDLHYFRHISFHNTLRGDKVKMLSHILYLPMETPEEG